MATAKIKKGDSVVVRSGKDKGRTGTVLQVLPKDGKVVVGGVNMIARHRKPTQTNPQTRFGWAAKIHCYSDGDKLPEFWISPDLRLAGPKARRL
jgi:ribosomal protein L24